MVGYDAWKTGGAIDMPSGNGRPDPKHGRCACGFSGYASAIGRHHRETGHPVTWKRIPQACSCADKRHGTVGAHA